MNEYIKNVNLFLSETKIKPSYIILKSDIDENKILSILSGTQNTNSDDMNKIAKALGKDIDFFLKGEQQKDFDYEFQKGIYLEEISKKQKQITDKALQLLENVDMVMSSKERFINILK